MRNKHPGPCYICGKMVAVGDGHFERNGRGGWRVRHVACKPQARPKTVKETSMALVGVYTRKGIVGLIEGGQLTIDGINYGVGALQKVSMVTGEPPESLLRQLATQVELASAALDDLKSQS